MDDDRVLETALINLPCNTCALTNQPTDNPVVMHKDLSDWWPPSLRDMRDDRVRNWLIVDEHQRDLYYQKLGHTGVVLALSGGLDSTTVLHWCLRIFGQVHCLIYDYNQRHKIEIQTAVDYIEEIGHDNITWQVVNMQPINELADSALTRATEVPKDRSVDEMTGDIPITFVPGRNIYFTTALAQVAYSKGWRHIALGVNILDYSGYPDCRPEFLEAMREALRIGIFNGTDIAIHAPLMYVNKQHIIKLGNYLGVDYARTHSCYEGIKGGCGQCDSCILRRAAFVGLGQTDPSMPE